MGSYDGAVNAFRSPPITVINTRGYHISRHGSRHSMIRWRSTNRTQYENDESLKSKGLFRTSTKRIQRITSLVQLLDVSTCSEKSRGKAESGVCPLDPLGELTHNRDVYKMFLRQDPY